MLLGQLFIPLLNTAPLIRALSLRPKRANANSSVGRLTSLTITSRTSVLYMCSSMCTTVISSGWEVGLQRRGAARHAITTSLSCQLVMVVWQRSEADCGRHIPSLTLIKPPAKCSICCQELVNSFHHKASLHYLAFSQVNPIVLNPSIVKGGGV